MNKQSSKVLLAVSGAVLTLSLWTAPALVRAEGIFKNLKVLPADTDKPTLKAIMKKQAKALGVECDHCHTQPNMEADTDNKKIGREMMAMVEEINKDGAVKDAKGGSKEIRKAREYYKKNFAGKKEMHCMNCHEGKEKPVVK